MSDSVLVENDQVVCDLRDAIRDGDSGLRYVPRLLRRVLETGAWRDRVDRATGQPVPFGSFAEFAATKPTEGLGADLDLIRRVIANDAVALDLLDQALRNPEGGSAQRRATVDVINSGRPDGTSKAYALRRLRDAAPEIHARVLAGDISPHAAMVEAGFTPPTFTVRGDSADAVARTLRRRLPPDVLADVARMLAEPAA